MLNDMGVDPYEWFNNPLDSMTIATYVENDGSTGPLIPPPYKRKDLPAELMEVPTSVTNPRPEEEIADWFTDKPDESDEIEKEKTLHHKMYAIATDKYNPFSVGGSESINSIGGSENVI